MKTATPDVTQRIGEMVIIEIYDFSVSEYSA